MTFDMAIKEIDPKEEVSTLIQGEDDIPSQNEV